MRDALRLFGRSNFVSGTAMHRTLVFATTVGVVLLGSAVDSTAQPLSPCTWVERQLQDRYSTCDERFELRVDCTAPEPAERDPPSRLVLERGSGHGGGIEITEWVARSETVQVTRLVLSDEEDEDLDRRSFHGERPWDVEVRVGSTGAGRYERAAVRAIAAVRAEISIVDTAEALGGCAWGNSRDFYIQVDTPGAERARETFAGYEGMNNQIRYLPLQVAATALEDSVPRSASEEGTILAPGPLKRDHRQLFARRFATNQHLFSSDFYWWVGEAYIHSAARAGTADVVDDLEYYLRLPEDPRPSDRRMQKGAINSIAALTGDDLRWTAGGTPRPVDAVAADYRELL